MDMAVATEAGKDSKDRMQAAELVRAIEHTGRTSELAEAWSELWRDKAKRRSFVLRGVRALPDDTIDIIARSAIRNGEEPFRDGEPPVVTLRNLIHSKAVRDG